MNTELRIIEYRRRMHPAVKIKFCLLAFDVTVRLSQ